MSRIGIARFTTPAGRGCTAGRLPADEAGQRDHERRMPIWRTRSPGSSPMQCRQGPRAGSRTEPRSVVDVEEPPSGRADGAHIGDGQVDLTRSRTSRPDGDQRRGHSGSTGRPCSRVEKIPSTPAKMPQSGVADDTGSWPIVALENALEWPVTSGIARIVRSSCLVISRPPALVVQPFQVVDGAAPRPLRS